VGEMTREYAERLRRICLGFEDPEDRCPYHPDECVCCAAHAFLRRKDTAHDR